MATYNTMYQLAFPDQGWKETTVHTFEGPVDGGVQHNLILVIDPFVQNEISLDEYASAQLEGPKNAMPGFEMVSKIEKHLPDNTPYLEIVYKYVPDDGIVLFQKQVYIIKDKKASIFTSTFSKKTLKTIANEIDKIIASFKLFKMEQE